MDRVGLRFTGYGECDLSLEKRGGSRDHQRLVRLDKFRMMRIMISGEIPEAGLGSLYKKVIVAATPLHMTKFSTGPVHWTAY